MCHEDQRLRSKCEVSDLSPGTVTMYRRQDDIFIFKIYVYVNLYSYLENQETGHIVMTDGHNNSQQEDTHSVSDSQGLVQPIGHKED